MKYDKEALALAVADCASFSCVCKKLGVKSSTGYQSHLKQRIAGYGISTSHFTGRGWAAGRTFEKKPLEFYLCRGSSISSTALRKRLIAAGLKTAQCEMCFNTEWLGYPIPLELHHGDGDHRNNEISNLVILCPTCHAIAGMAKRQTQHA